VQNSMRRTACQRRVTRAVQQAEQHMPQAIGRQGPVSTPLVEHTMGTARHHRHHSKTHNQHSLWGILIRTGNMDPGRVVVQDMGMGRTGVRGDTSTEDQIQARAAAVPDMVQ
jgi:hypothetical protein